MKSTLDTMVAGLRTLRETSIDHDEAWRARGLNPGEIGYAMDGESLEVLIDVLEQARAQLVDLEQAQQQLARAQRAVRRAKALAIAALGLALLSLALSVARVVRG